VDSAGATDFLKALLLVNGGTLVAILSFGWKIVRFVNTIEFKTDLMWTDYRRRMDSQPVEGGFLHRRRDDETEANDEPDQAARPARVRRLHQRFLDSITSGLIARQPDLYPCGCSKTKVNSGRCKDYRPYELPSSSSTSS
jgi:hypothetical protein